ncbi:hypothetical protein OH76DRAFT_1421496 [Lentinus brumalis]|uniref:Uncharacterized protein n=1 Tax=Lentinus brumalis TaxID=2498619 RepID=A0A371CV51_9APHY|nr:hypothetical protein OH76DRAFT_1421496 [Polyporus brumalis]
MTSDRTSKPGHSVTTEGPSLTVAEWMVRLVELAKVWDILHPGVPMSEPCEDCMDGMLLGRRHVHGHSSADATGAPGERQLWDNVSPDSTFLADHLPPILPVPDAAGPSSSTSASRAVAPDAGPSMVQCPEHGWTSRVLIPCVCHDGPTIRDAPLNAQHGPAGTESIADSLDDFSVDDFSVDDVNGAEELYANPLPGLEAAQAHATATGHDTPVVAAPPAVVVAPPPAAAGAVVAAPPAPVTVVAAPPAAVVAPPPVAAAVDAPPPVAAAVVAPPPVAAAVVAPPPVAAAVVAPPPVAVVAQPPVAVVAQPPVAVVAQPPVAVVAPPPAAVPAQPLYTPFFAPASHAPMWYVVTCGKTVGVFDDSAVMVHSVSRVSGGAGRGGFATREAAIAAFRNAEAAEVVRQVRI